MTYNTIWNGAGATWQPAGDYLLDWDLTGADGAATLSAASGDDPVCVTVSTPTNGQCDSFSLKDGQLFSNDVAQPTISEIAFDAPVCDVNFQLIDVDQGCNWDDEVTILAYDADGNLVDVDFDAISGAQSVSGNTIEGEGALCDTGITVSVAGPVVKLVIVHDNGPDAGESGHIKVTDLGFNAMPEPDGDGVVDGTDGDDLIDLDYTGDPHGDRVDADDALLPGEGGDDDIILAGDGDDIVFAGEGDDEVYAGSGDDTVEGGAGDDVIYGDNGGASADTTLRESFNWEGVVDAQIDSAFTQDTGSVEVCYTRLEDTGSHFSEPGTDAVNGDGIDTGAETLDPDSSLHSETGGSCGAGTFEWAFSETVQNVEFNINDLDGDGVVTIRAYDADGNEIPVSLIGGSCITLLDGAGATGANVADSDGGYGASDSDAYNVQVTIAGPVAKIVLEHEQDGAAHSGINVTDIFFDVTVPGEDGDDALFGGAGDDALHGEGGEDYINGGAGDDLVYAGEGNDEVHGGDGADTVFGQAGDDMIDTSGSAPASDYGADLPGTLYDVAEDADKLDDIDFVDGGAGDDTIFTGDDADTILGGTGADLIDGGLDDDIIDGGADDDTIIGGHGSDQIEGGSGNDTIWGGMGDGTDILNIEDEDDPSWHIDDPRPDNGIDVIHGGDGDDVIYGQDDDDVLYGDAGNDVIDGGIDDDAIFGGTGDDTIEGGKGEDFIDGGAGNDQLAGGDDRDWFAGVNAGDTVDGNEGGDDWDTLDLTGSAAPGGSLNVTYTSADQEDGVVTYKDEDGNALGTLDFFNIEKVVPCFTPGTRIATPKGEVPVERLKAGDRVITRDNGIQEIKWVGARAISFTELAKAEHLAPIHIRAGALGNGLPERDMMLSPNHRVLVANDRTSLYFDEREVLAAAKHLVDSKGVQTAQPMGVTYVHFMCQNHEVVLSDGAWTESFQPGDHSLNGIGNAQRQELFELFPELETREGLEDYTAARRILRKHEAQMLLRG